MIKYISLAITALMGLSISSVSAPALAKDDPIILKADQAWALDYGENRCRLLRTFSSAEDRSVILFEQDGPSSSFGVTAAGPAFDRWRGSRETTVRFGDDPEDSDHQPFIGDFGPVGSALIFSSLHIYDPSDDEHKDEDEYVRLGRDRMGLPRLATQRFAGLDKITFSQRGKTIVMQTGNLEEPMKALNTCSQDLVKDWGLNLEKHKSLTKMPKWTNAEEVAGRIQKSYSSAALRKGEQGIFQMRLIVDGQGAVAECHLVNTTAVNALESPACREMENAQFEPALDSEGTPMRSFYVTRVVYKMGVR